MATKKKYINADDALNNGLDLEVAPYESKEILADSQGRYVGQNGLTVDDLDMVGTGEYINATNYNNMPSGYSIVNNPYQAASPDQIAHRKNQSQVSTNMNDLTLMGDDSYNQILQYQQQWADANAAGDKAGMDAAHAAAEALRAKYGYSGGADGSEHLGLMAYTGNREDEDEDDSDYGRATSALNTDKFDYASAPQYVSQYQAQIDALTQQILGRQPFSYNPETDETYQQYKADYIRMGNRAMQDTLAQLSARTGGLASSYAGSASQQAYNNYMAELASKIPELKQLAYSMYMDDLNNQRNDLSMLQSLEQGDYAKYLDQLGQYNTDRNFDYGAYRDTIADNQWNQSFDYQKEQDALAQQNYLNEFAYQQQMDQLAQDNYLNEWNYQLEQDALARQDALNKLYASSGGGKTAASALQVIYGMDNEAEVYDYLVNNGYSNAEVQSYMNYWAQNRKPEASPEAPSGNYGAIVELMQEMQGEEVKISEVRQMLEEAYRDGMITETEYRKLLNQSR